MWPFWLWYTIRTVAYNIPEILRTRKAQDVVLISAVVLLGFLSYGLGRLSAQSSSASGVILCESLPPNTVSATVAQTPSYEDREMSTATIGEVASFVGSKNGSVYHFPWCSGAQRIKEENKVWFTTKEEAERAGYRPASNCKGL